MKQSTKLLSLVLALVMAFSFVTVIGNAALVKSEVAYDVIDDADLSPEQVADIIMDLLDKLIILKENSLQEPKPVFLVSNGSFYKIVACKCRIMFLLTNLSIFGGK